VSDGETQLTGKAAKRARKKTFRDEQRIAWEAALRRRRNARLAIGAGLIAALVVGAIVAGGGNEKDDRQGSAAAGATPDCERSGDPPVEAAPQQYDKAPPMSLEEGVDYSAVVTTSCGELTIDLDEEGSPINVNNFVFLATEGYYDGLIWHRVERNAVIQTGDPNGQNGTEPDGPGYTVKDEVPGQASAYIYGVVAMANTGLPNSAGSQWFIVTHGKPGSDDAGQPAGYDPKYSIIGTVDQRSYEVLDIIDRQPTRGGDDDIIAVLPKVPIYIELIEIVES
jgi:peptidylprolyl isomerase